MLMLESIKNQYLGRPHYPHGYMVDKGIHALTIQGTYDSKASKISDKDKFQNTMQLMEHLIRVTD